MRAVVLIDYPDVRRNAKRAFRIANDDETHIDPLCCAALLVARSHVPELMLEMVRVHHAIPHHRDHPGDARIERARMRDWVAADARVELRRRTLRVPRHNPQAKPQDKGIATAIALDASLLLMRGHADHVIVFSHREHLVALGEVVRDRRAPGRSGLEFAAWRSEVFRTTVPHVKGVGNQMLRESDFERCRAR